MKGQFLIALFQVHYSNFAQLLFIMLAKVEECLIRDECFFPRRSKILVSLSSRNYTTRNSLRKEFLEALFLFSRNWFICKNSSRNSINSLILTNMLFTFKFWQQKMDSRTEDRGL